MVKLSGLIFLAGMVLIAKVVSEDVAEDDSDEPKCECNDIVIGPDKLGNKSLLLYISTKFLLLDR